MVPDVQRHGMRTTTEVAVRIQLLLLAPVMLALIGIAGARGGAWLVVLPPAGGVLALHAQLVVRVGLRSWLPSLGNLAMLGSGVALLLLVVGPVLGLYRTVTVLSGSMRPTFSPGDVIVVTRESPTALRPGQVISFETPTLAPYVETHRVISVLQGGAEPIVVTKGDANNSLDPWHAQLHGTLWRYRLRLPMLGYPILVMREPWVRRVSVFLLPALLALLALGKLWIPPVHRKPRHA